MTLARRIKWVLAFVSIVVAIILGATCMSQQNWYHLKVRADGDQYNFQIGLKKYHGEIKKANGDLVTRSGTLSSGDTTGYKEVDPLMSRLASGGDWILGCGIVGLTFCSVSVLLLMLSLCKQKVSLRYWSGGLLLLSAVVMTLGVFSYCGKAYGGASLLAFSTCCFIAFSVSFTGASAYVGSTVHRKRVYFMVVMMVVVLVMAIASMATYSWYEKDADGSHVKVGLRKFTVQSTNFTGTFNLDSYEGRTVLSDDLSSKLVSGGEAILGAGSVALLLVALSLAAAIYAFKKTSGRAQVLSSVLLVGAGLLVVLGAILYAEKIGISYGFMGFFVSVFLILFACALLMSIAVSELKDARAASSSSSSSSSAAAGAYKPLPDEAV